MSMVGHFMLLVSLASASLQDIVTRSSQDPSSCVQIANPWWCDPTKELTCTPYNYRPFTYNLQHGNVCNGEVFDLLTGSRSDARAWAYFDATGKASSGDFFVFHACDGAGLQSDCKGDIKYVEHFAGRAQGNSCQQDPKTSSNMRNYCKFKHPGTGTIYENYEAGWWNDGNAGGQAPNGITDYMAASSANGQWGDGVKRGVVTQAVMAWPNPYMQYDGKSNGYGTMHAISFTTFPWVCTRSDNGDNYFAAPSQVETGVKCYADNEPGWYKNTPGWPPYVYIYHMLLYKEASGKMALKGQKSTIELATSWSIQGPEAEFVLYQCHPGDACPW